MSIPMLETVSPTQPLNKRVSFRLTTNEHRILEKVCRTRKIKKSDLFRSLLTQAIDPSKPHNGAGPQQEK